MTSVPIPSPGMTAILYVLSLMGPALLVVAMRTVRAIRPVVVRSVALARLLAEPALLLQPTPLLLQPPGVLVLRPPLAGAGADRLVRGAHDPGDQDPREHEDREERDRDDRDGQRGCFAQHGSGPLLDPAPVEPVGVADRETAHPQSAVDRDRGHP